jgi:molybdenum cofactor cytidylyltransferase
VTASGAAGAGAARFAGIIPSAGASARMGQPKALLRVGRETFLERTVGALRRGGCDPVFVVVAEGDEEAARQARTAGARVIENPEPGEGPITSLRLALAALDESAAGLVYLPVDHPLVRPDTVRALLDASRSAAAKLALPVHEGERGHPAVFGRALFAELSDPSLEGGARTVTHRHLDEALLVDVADPGVLTDIDTPETYDEAVGGRPHPGDVRR